jgi:hypothetical protein
LVFLVLLPALLLMVVRLLLLWLWVKAPRRISFA